MLHDTSPTVLAGSTGEGRVATFFGLRGDAWMRHANPRSVWTRFTCVSLVVVAVWSREWIGWYCLIPIALASAWTWVNPRLFGVPTSTRSWASKSVFGERIWTERRSTQLPEQFRSRVPNLANAYSCLGLALLVYGVVAVDVWLTIAGIAVVHGGKLWYLDRMVLLFEDMKQRDATFASWEYGS
jgi:hypothetical protein